MRVSIRKFVPKNILSFSKTFGSKFRFSEIFQHSKRFQQFRDLASYVHAVITDTGKKPYDFFRSPSVLKKRKPQPCTCKDDSAVMAPSVIRKETHKICFWDQREKPQYNSIGVPAPINRPSTSGKVLITTKIPGPPRQLPCNKPIVELHTWNQVEPRQYGYWFNEPIKRQSAAKIRMISRRQKDAMYFTKFYN